MGDPPDITLHAFARVGAALLLAVGVASLPGPAFAWSNAVHEVVCRIAVEHLDAPGLALVNRVRSYETKQMRTESFEKSCRWADTSRGTTHRGTYEYHFINSPEGQPFDLQRDCAAFDCTLVGIQRYALVLQDERARRTKRTHALRFLAHFVADVHQPLHCGNEGDGGGNSIKVGWFGSFFTKWGPMSLHGVWDSQVPRRARFTSGKAALELYRRTTPAQKKAWRDTDLAGWAAESRSFALEAAYPRAPGSLGAVSKGDDLRDAYYERAQPIVREQLQKAGVRLAHLINLAARGRVPRDMLELR